MESVKDRKVEVIDKIVVYQDSLGNLVNKDIDRIEVDIPWSTVRRYSNCLGLLFGLSKGARNLIDFLVEKEMNDKNMVRNDDYVRDAFKEFLQAAPGVTVYNDTKIHEFFRELTEKNFLFKEKRSIYKVNPMFFTKNLRFDKHVDMIKLYFKITADETVITVTNEYRDKDENNY